MGQRLVIDIYDGEKVLTNCYYHWSAYTGSSLQLTKEFLSGYNDAVARGITDKRLAAIKALEGTGASLTRNAREIFRGIYPNERFADRELDRSDGLIELSEDEMEVSRGWAEGYVKINLSERKVNFTVFCETDTETICYYLDLDTEDIDECNKKIDEWTENQKDIADGFGDIFDVSFDDFEKYSQKIQNADDMFKWNGEIYLKIE